MYPIEIKNITDTNVEDFISEGENNDVYAKYYSPTCGHCIEMEKDWEKMCNKLKKKQSDKKLLIVEIDPSALQKLQNTNIHSDVMGFPSIHYLKNGNQLKN